MNPRTTALLALVALGLGAFVFFHEIEGDVARNAAIDDAKKIHAGLEAMDVTAVTLTTLDGIPAHFERQDDRWQVVTPVLARADTTALDAIVHALVNMPREGSIAAGGSLDGFGLGEGAQTVRFEVAGETRGLRIGGSTPVGGHRYVARLGDGEVAFVASYRVNAFNRKLDDLRDRRIFHFDAGAVQTLRVAWPSGRGGQESEVALARNAAGEWHLGVPIVGPADQEVVRDLLSNLVYLRAEKFVDESEVAGSTQLETALAETMLRFHWTLDGEHLERGARIAGVVDGQRVLEVPGGGIFEISAERLDDFPRAVVDYRLKRMSSFEISAARRLEMEFPLEGNGIDRTATLRVVAELGESGWSSPEPSIDPVRAASLVRELASLRAIDIVADEMGPNELASLGLNPPQARIRVEGGADPEHSLGVLADLAIGRFDPDRGVFGQRGDSATIFLLSVEAAEDLPISAERYRSAFEVGADDHVDEPDDELELDDPDVADPLEGVELL